MQASYAKRSAHVFLTFASCRCVQSVRLQTGRQAWCTIESLPCELDHVGNGRDMVWNIWALVARVPLDAGLSRLPKNWPSGVGFVVEGGNGVWRDTRVAATTRSSCRTRKCGNAWGQE